MADAVTAEYIHNGNRRKVLHLTSVSDGTGEAAVVKADISTLTFNGGQVPTGSAVDIIDYNIQGFTSVKLYWEHTTDDEIAVLPAGQGTIDWASAGGKADPRSSGGTGDIVLTSPAGATTGTYDITIYFRPKA